ncbi:unnamed protein product [Arabis nemorensis]|uniref:Uncharacterized protein n=1 Tax=Arabis nemorensis TaxID=586526 RepID=A0A565AW86_9BRAS|nr:unnamed protein product [Arabis nemorensis]
MFKITSLSTSFAGRNPIKKWNALGLSRNVSKKMSRSKGWTSWLEPACLLWQPGGRGYVRPPYMTRTDDDKPQYTPDQELAIMAEQVNSSDGFEIDFSFFRCVFNYHPVILNIQQFVDEPETDEDLLNRLSQGSLDGYNQTNKTEFEFVMVVKANNHWASAIMFLITFQVKDPYDDHIKLFQARVRYAEDIMLEYVFCRPKPDKGVKCVGTAKNDVEKDVKKQRLE